MPQDLIMSGHGHIIILLSEVLGWLFNIMSEVLSFQPRQESQNYARFTEVNFSQIRVDHIFVLQALPNAAYNIVGYWGEGEVEEGGGTRYIISFSISYIAKSIHRQSY